VREQVPHPHGLGRRHRERLVLAAAGPHPRVRKRGDEALDRVVELERAFLPQQHRRDGCDRLGHRVDAELRVELDRQARLDVAQAALGDVDHLAVAGDQREEAGQLALVDVALVVAVDAVEAFRVEAGLDGICLDGEHGRACSQAFANCALV
jgi:hypothetical protein